MQFILKIILSLLLSVLSMQLSFGQATVFNSSFQSFEKRADNFHEKQFYNKALDLYLLASQKEPENNYVKIQIADCYSKLRQPTEAVVWYDKVPASDSLFNEQHILQFAHALSQSGEVEKAAIWYKKYQSLNQNDKRIEKVLRYIGEPGKMRQDTTQYDVEEVAISTEAPEFSASYYGDEGIVFVGTFEKSSAIKYGSLYSSDTYFDLYFSAFDIDPEDPKKFILKPPTFFDKKINSNLHEGPLAFANQETKIVFTRNMNKGSGENKSSDGITRLGLFEAERESRNDEEWANIREFPFNSKEYSVCHPTLNRDGTALYFASNKPGGFGGYDIYRSTFVDGYWTAPVNLGKPINTEGNEVYPFLFNDETIYFASNGHAGYGGLDIFKINITLEGNPAGDLYHLIQPINSNADDFAMVLDPVGTAGYITSNRRGGINDDLFKVYETEAYKSKEINYLISGIVKAKKSQFDNTNLQVLDSVKVTLLDKLTRDTLASIYTNTEGQFMLSKAQGQIKYPGEYTIFFEKEKYGTIPIQIEIPQDESFEKDINIQISPEIEEPVVQQDSLQQEVDTEELGIPDLDEIVFPDWQTEPAFPDTTAKSANPLALQQNNTQGDNREPTQESVGDAADAKLKRQTFNLQGLVLEGNTNRKVEGARIYASSEGGDFLRVEVDDKGSFDLDLSKEKQYILKAVAEGYSSDCFEVEPIEPGTKYKQTEPFRISKINFIDTLIAVNDLDFSLNNYRLNEDSYEKLNPILQFIEANNQTIVEIGAHSSKGANSFNAKDISQLQSLSIIEFLMSRGIPRDRLIAKGYGNTRPIFPCPLGNCSEEQRKQNERIELQVINYRQNFVSEQKRFNETKNGVRLTRVNCSETAIMYPDNNETLFEGNTVDLSSQLPLDSALVHFYNVETGAVKRIYSDAAGKIITHLTTDTEYIIKAFKKDHKPDCFRVKINSGQVRLRYNVPWSLEFIKNLSDQEQERMGYWGGNLNYASCIERED